MAKKKDRKDRIIMSLSIVIVLLLILIVLMFIFFNTGIVNSNGSVVVQLG